MEQDFNPNAASAKDSGVFGLPFSADNSALVILPVPWEVTTSYGGGTCFGPEAILNASKQMDLFDLTVADPYQSGIAMLPTNSKIQELNDQAKSWAQQVIAGDLSEDELEDKIEQVNGASEKLNQWVYQETLSWLNKGKIVGLLGGDHSTPFGFIKALAEKNSDFGILHFDAHSDTREAYMGFTHSHASIMFNVLQKIPQVSKLVQIGIRDFCQEEYELIKDKHTRVKTFFDKDIWQMSFQGNSFHNLAEKIISELPKKVYISFDIDGLDPVFCPNTGTPVPGGLQFNQAIYLLELLIKSGRKIIGFDLVEVAPDKNNQNEWDANVGMRLLFKLSALTLVGQGKASLR